jgi:hypothetical protein
VERFTERFVASPPFGTAVLQWPYYPFSKAEDAGVKALKLRGYQRIVTFREPESSYLRRILAKNTLKAVYFIGHGRIYSARYPLPVERA